MAPIDFEKKIKELFDGREIKPGRESWDKISSQLKTTPVRRKPRPFIYWAAASVAFVLMVLGWSVRNTFEPSDNMDSVVERPGGDSPLSLPEVVPESNTQAQISAKEEAVDTSVRQEAEYKIAVENSGQLTQAEQKDPIAPGKTDREMELLMDEKITELVAQVGAMEVEQQVVTESEADDLLREAQRDLLSRDEFQGSDEGSAAASLLADVEDELDESFRDQVFERLKQGYIRVRTAVADRNK